MKKYATVLLKIYGTVGIYELVNTYHKGKNYSLVTEGVNFASQVWNSISFVLSMYRCQMQMCFDFKDQEENSHFVKRDFLKQWFCNT